MKYYTLFPKLMRGIYEFISRQTFLGLLSALLVNFILYGAFSDIHSSLLWRRHLENRIFDRFMSLVDASLPCRAMSEEFARELDRIASTLTDELARRRSLRVSFGEERQVFQLTLATYRTRYSSTILYKTPSRHELTRDGWYSAEVSIPGTGRVTCQRAISIAESFLERR